MLERLEHALLRGASDRRHLGGVLSRPRRFKFVNDTYGHRVGDELLIAVGQRLARVLRPGDSLARLSGDEFVVLCEGLRDSAEGDESLSVSMLRWLTHSSSLARSAGDASIGVAFTGQGGDAPEELIHDADLAMYRTKRTRNRDQARSTCVSCTSPSTRPAWREDCPGALERGELQIEYQPIVTHA